MVARGEDTAARAAVGKVGESTSQSQRSANTKSVGLHDLERVWGMVIDAMADSGDEVRQVQLVVKSDHHRS